MVRVACGVRDLADRKKHARKVLVSALVRKGMQALVHELKVSLTLRAAERAWVLMRAENGILQCLVQVRDLMVCLDIEVAKELAGVNVCQKIIFLCRVPSAQEKLIEESEARL